MIWIGCVLAYLAIGAIAGRLSYGLVYRRHGGIDAEFDAGWAAWLTLLLWPLLPLPFAAVGVHRWFHAPIARDETKAERLRDDARRWDEKRRSGTDAEQEMARELADMCRARANEVQP